MTQNKIVSPSTSKTSPVTIDKPAVPSFKVSWSPHVLQYRIYYQSNGIPDKILEFVHIRQHSTPALMVGGKKTLAALTVSHCEI
jgi:hypothetical protein